MRAALAFIALVVLMFAPAAAAPGDVAGSADYPGIGRFDGSVITGYEARDFDAAVIQAKPFVNNAPTDARALEGRLTRIAYRAPAGASLVEVSRNFKNQAVAAGFEIVLECETAACGGRKFVDALQLLPVAAIRMDPFNYRYISARRKAGASGPETWIDVITSVNNSVAFSHLRAIEIGAMENKMVDAAAMKKGLAEEGRIALYGIYFDTGKADVKPESAPTLAEIAKLLKADPKLTTVYVVGHTDSQGGFDYNMDLSKRRAAAIAAELAAKHGVAAARLKTAGVGFLAPVASNATEAGRALNRRTELVLP